MVDPMVAKSAYSAVTYWPGQVERRTVAPWHVPRRRWRSGERVRALGVQVDQRPTAVVWLEDRDHAGLVFRLELDGDGQLVGFAVRPLAFVGEYRPDGTPVVLGVEVDDNGPVDGTPRLSANLLQRGVKIGRLHQAATAALERFGRVVPTDAPVTTGEQPRRVRQSALSDAQLAGFVAEYVHLLAQGLGRDVTKRLAARHHLSEGGAIYRVRVARSRGLLTATTRGRPGGALTAKARALLAG